MNNELVAPVPQGQETIEKSTSDAEHDLRNIFFALQGAALLTGFVWRHIEGMKATAAKDAEKVLTQYDQDRAATVPFPGVENTTTTIAALDGVKYYVKELDSVPAPIHSVADNILTNIPEGEQAQLANLVESDVLQQLGDEIGESASDIAGKSKIIQAGRSMQGVLTGSTPLEPHHVQSLLHAAGGMAEFVGHMSIMVRVVEEPIKDVIRALKGSTLRLQDAIGGKLSERIQFDPATHLSNDQVIAKLKSWTTEMNITLPSEADWSKDTTWEQLAKSLSGKYVFSHAGEILKVDDKGNHPAQFDTLATAVEMIGSLDVHQNQSSQIKAS